ncbi:SpoIIE family protein phosphatase [candidate division KSB1 bacterium]|nr:SpoIIE family protein phosphatase [candidate division KSB1 bacterium]
MSKSKSKKIDPPDLVNDPLKDQLELKDRALSVAVEGITISDFSLDGNPIIYANEGFERLTGYDRQEVMGRNCRFLQGQDTDPETIQEIRQAIRDQVPVTVEILNYRKDSVPFWNRLSNTPVRDHEGNVTHFIGLQSDVTERVHAEKALREATLKLEAVNRNMKNDLEAARELQLDMLPERVPDLPYLDIAVQMKTAQEVGGDYYDFHIDRQGHLTFTIGDATGHGLKAGTIVTATKALFNMWAHYKNPVRFLKRASGALKDMGFRNMYMALVFAKITPDELVYSSAGMPYALYYDATASVVRELVVKGMPLAAFPDFPYRKKQIKLSRNDLIVFLSDGILEQRNSRNEFFEDHVNPLFATLTAHTPVHIANTLIEQAVHWNEQGQVFDDMTVLVLRVK